MEQVEQVEQVEQGGGNTITPPKLSSKKRKFCFTLNNWKEEDIKIIVEQWNKDKYIIGKEIGASGTPHLQGYIEFKSPRSFTSIKKVIPRAHIEGARGTTKDNYIYCSKDGDFQTNIKGIITPKKIKDPITETMILRPFQAEIVNLIKEEPDTRSIYWYWETEGNVGKTSLCKHLCINYNCLVLNGKQNDMFNAILQWKEAKGDYPEIIIIDIPRSTIDYVSFGAIEKIKDGLFYSGKYEGGMVVMNSPHIICMANSEPNTEKMSLDRWQITNIDLDE